MPCLGTFWLPGDHRRKHPSWRVWEAPRTVGSKGTTAGPSGTFGKWRERVAEGGSRAAKRALEGSD